MLEGLKISRIVESNLLVVRKTLESAGLVFLQDQVWVPCVLDPLKKKNTLQRNPQGYVKVNTFKNHKVDNRTTIYAFQSAFGNRIVHVQYLLSQQSLKT